MRLSLGDLAALPFCCALFDRSGKQIQCTPEWHGFSLGALTYEAGAGTLVVAPDGSSTDVDGLVMDLVAEMMDSTRALGRSDRMAVDMLVSALALVAGRAPILAVDGTVDDVVEHFQEGVRRSVPGLQVTVEIEVAARLASPAAIAVGLVQLARNAARHAGAETVTLRVARGPTFRIEWRAPGDATPVATARRPDQRNRWGMGFTRLLADSLGGVVTAPAAVAPGIVASSIGLGSPRFSAPVACVVDGRIERAARAWDEEVGLAPGAALNQRVQLAVDAALRRPGEIAYSDILRARSVPGRVWLGVAPQSSLGRARDVLRGIQHENALLSAAEPHATRVYALSAILAAVVTGEPVEPVPVTTWSRHFPRACAALGVPVNDPLDPDRLRYPDPRVTAYLLATLNGGIADAQPAVGYSPGGPVALTAAPAQRSHVLVRLLGGSAGVISLAA